MIIPEPVEKMLSASALYHHTDETMKIRRRAVNARNFNTDNITN